MSTNSPDSTNPSPEVIAGIDLGTTYSSIALFREGQIQVLDIDGSPLLPSYVGLSESNELLVGHPARNQYILYPEKTIKSIKRRMGGTESIPLGDRSFLPEEISALILGYMKQKAEAALGFPIRRAVITVPAFFNDTQRQATRAAGEIAGLEVVRILNEPTAASLAFRKSLLSQNQSHRGISVVYDLGGGTFDVSIVNEESDLTEVLASRGDTRLGGDDFDRLILEHFLAHLQREYRVDLRDDRRALHRLTHAAEAAKIGLSSNPYTQVVEEEIAVVNGKSIHLDLELSRREYEEMIHNLIDRTLDCVHEAMRDAQVTPAQVENVLLAGGSTRTPLVREVLENLFEKEPRSELHPDLCVAMGAGILAARLQGLEVEQILVDITPHTFCIAALHIEPDGYPNPYYFARIVPRNTPLPVTRSEEFSTVIDDQEIVNVQIFQGEDDDVRYNTRIGNFHIQGLSKVPAGNLIIARKMDPQKVKIAGEEQEVDLGHVGEVEEIHPAVLNTLLDKGYIPVISPIAIDRHGQSLNINADTAAGEIAIALDAYKLINMTDVDGIMDATRTRVYRRLRLKETEQLMGSGVISEGMIPKVSSIVRAVQHGVCYGHVINGNIAHNLLLEMFTDEGVGTMICKE